MITVFVFHNKVLAAKGKAEQKKARKKEIEKNPLVTFRYDKGDSWNIPMRMVRVISATEKYIWGLDMTDKNRPKKFLRSKMVEFSFRGFNIEAMP
jgi:hypothetical protein